MLAAAILVSLGANIPGKLLPLLSEGIGRAEPGKERRRKGA